MPRPGRKARQNVARYENGRIKRGPDRVKPEDVMGVVLRQPHRFGKPNARDSRWGYALGRLRMREDGSEGSGITEGQHDTACRFVDLYRRNARHRGWPNPNLKSPAVIMIGGTDCAPEAEGDAIDRDKRSWSDAYRAIIDAEKDYGPLFEAVKAVCIEDRDPDTFQLGNLRLALNALAHLWKG